VTAVAILSLALGIGANTAIFSIVDSAFVRELPVDAPDRLVAVSDARAGRFGSIESWTYDVWHELRDRAQPFDGACAFWYDHLNLSTRGGEADPVDALWVSGRYFSTLGVGTVLGRALGPEDNTPGANAAAVISYRFWQRRFGGAADAIGQSLSLETVPFTIVGITPPDFFGTAVGRTFDVALPIGAERRVRGPDSRLSPGKSVYALTVMLRLKPDQSVKEAAAILRGLQPQIRAAAMPPNMPAAFRPEFMKDPFLVVPAATGTSGLRTRYGRPLAVVFTVVALVLLVACANIANLQLARATARSHDLSVRVALGASRWRIARELLAESALVAAAGTGAGLVLAAWIGPAIVSRLSSTRTPIYLDLRFDWRVLAFTAAAGIATTVLFGVAPAIRASTVAPIDALKRSPRGALAGGPARLSAGLVVAQVALSMLIVVSAGLFVRTFERLSTLPVGVDAGRVLIVGVNTRRTHVEAARRLAFADQLRADVAALPGVERAAVSLTTPSGGMGLVDLVYQKDASPSEGLNALGPGGLGPRATYLNFVTPGWFATYGTTIEAGRDFDDRDVAGAPPVVIVNQAFVRKFLRGTPPLGAIVRFDRGHGAPVEKTVVGVVEDAIYSSLRHAEDPVEYAPIAQLDFPTPPAIDASISVRAAHTSPMRLARSIAAALTAENRDLVFSFATLDDQIDGGLTQERALAQLSGVFAALALLLAGIGLYGVTAYAVVCRRSEIGIRMALGATTGAIVRLVAARVVSLLAVGVVAGAILSAWASRYVASLLFGITAHDVVTYAAGTAILAAAAALAAWPPVWRASRVDPAVVLREG
jgi:predicted permease